MVVAAFFAAVGLATLVGLLLDPLDFDTRADARRAREQGERDGREAVWPEGYKDGYRAGFIDGIEESIAASAPSEFGSGYSAGFVNAWNGALELAEAAARDAGLDESANEFDVLANMPRR